MRLVWKGKLNKNKGFPTPDIPSNAVAFLGENKPTELYSYNNSNISVWYYYFQSKANICTKFVNESKWILDRNSSFCFILNYS